MKIPIFMLKVLYEVPDKNMSSDEIAIYNLKMSDMFFNKETVYFSSIAWLKNKGDRTFLDVELLYRENNLNSYVEAKNITIEKNLELCCNGKDKEDLRFMFDVISKPNEIALQELTATQTYEENFKKLLATGYLKFLDDTKYPEHIEKLLENQILLKFVKYTEKESISELGKDLKGNLGYIPNVEIIGNYDENQPVMGFKTKEGKLASNIGWTIQKVGGEMVYRLIDLQTVIHPPSPSDEAR